MAKPLGPKSLLIRNTIQAHPDMGNKELAEKINDSADRLDDKITVTPQDVAQQKQQMKKTGPTARVSAAAVETPASAVPATPAPAKRGRPKGSKGGRPKKAAAMAPAARTTAPSASSPVDLIDGVFALASQCGGIDQLKRLVDRLAER